MRRNVFTWNSISWIPPRRENQTAIIIRRAAPKSPSVAERDFFSANLGDFGVFRRKAVGFFCKNLAANGIAWVVVFMLFVVASARAGETVPYTLAQRTQKAEAIVVAEVVAMSSNWDDEGREIYTYITLRIVEKIKGNLEGNQIVLRHLGGIVGNVESRVSGMPQFDRHEKVLVFLGRYPSSAYFGVMDWLEGKKTIQHDVAGQEMVRVGTRGERSQSLKAYISEIQSLLKQK